MTESLNMVYCEDIPKNITYDFKSLKAKIGLLLVLMSILGSLVGGIQNSFMRGFTISLGSCNLGLKAPTTYIYFTIAISMAAF